jgi:hypothetical protein
MADTDSAAYAAIVLGIVKQNIITHVVVASLISFFVCGLVVALGVAYFARYGWGDRWKWLVTYLLVVSVADTANNGSCVLMSLSFLALKADFSLPSFSHPSSLLFTDGSSTLPSLTSVMSTRLNFGALLPLNSVKRS